MLPNRMQLNRQTEEQLKKLKAYTGVTPNIAARLAFFRSVESNFRYSPIINEKKLDGILVLDKTTWLGNTAQATELILKMMYSSLEPNDFIRAWAAHVEDGISGLRNHKNFSNLLSSI